MSQRINTHVKRRYCVSKTKPRLANRPSEADPPPLATDDNNNREDFMAEEK
jgi:hypothetical protein